MTRPRPRTTWLVPVVLVALAVVVTVVVMALRGNGGNDGDRDGTGDGTATSTTALAVESDSPSFASVEELVDASDVVLRGTVESVERGRWFGSGDADGTRIESRLLAVRVEEVLAGTAPAGEAVLVEEEGWLEDGTPIVVDGIPQVAVGDDAVWFLVDGGDAELGAYVVVNGQGRYVVGDGGSLVGATGDDALVAHVEALGPEGLVGEVELAR